MKKLTTLLALAPAVLGLNTAVLSAGENEGPREPAENWRQHCQRCHGADGSGSTRIGQRLGLRDYTDAEVQKEFTDEEIIKIIKEGVKDARGREVKPSYTDVMSEEEIKAMVVYIRSMAKEE